ncbi:hypothetical protein ACER0C_001684 [Sarotherodon galilaeus]
MMKVLTVPLLVCTMMALAQPAQLSHRAPETAGSDDSSNGGGESSDTSEDAPDAAGRRCPYGWKRYRKRCFLFVSQPLSWAQAQKNCEQMNANLASVHCRKEHKFIRRLIFRATRQRKPTWLGGSNAKNGYWFWIDGTQFRYTNWCPGQPSNYYYEQCLQMNFGGHKCWDDAYCTKLLSSVCAKKI